MTTKKNKAGGARVGAGRKAFLPTVEQRDLVSQLRAFGIEIDSIPLFIKNELGKSITVPTLYKHFKDELNTGALRATAKVASSLYKKALGGDVTACIFWLKARAGWQPPTKVEVTGKDGSAIEQRTTIVNEAKIKEIVEKLEGEY